MSNLTPCKDCPKRHPLCHDRCETYRSWKEERAKEAAYTRQKKRRRRDTQKGF